MKIKEYVTRLLFTVVISVIICMMMNALFFDDPTTADLILKSVGLGVTIWLIAELSFVVVSKKWPHHILPGYIALFIIIAIGTGAGSWIIGVSSVWIILLICSCAEVCGFLITVIYRSIYKRRLNDQLEKFKRARNNLD